LERSSRKTPKLSFHTWKMPHKNKRLNLRQNLKLISSLLLMQMEQIWSLQKITWALNKKLWMWCKKSTLRVSSNHHSVWVESCHACWSIHSEWEMKRELTWYWSQELLP
jgi:hypothetical protein